jgi:hypothetical protein
VRIVVRAGALAVRARDGKPRQPLRFDPDLAAVLVEPLILEDLDDLEPETETLVPAGNSTSNSGVTAQS